jgi:hypothetical protein
MFKSMTYKEFCDYCNKRTYDGQWGAFDAIQCAEIIGNINAIKVKVLGFTSKKKTEEARERAWRKIIS